MANAQIENQTDLQVQFQAILDSMGEGVVTTDTQNLIISWNQKLEQMLGFKAEEVIGKDVLEVIHAQDEKGNLIPKEHRILNQAYLAAKRITGTYYFKSNNDRVFPVSVTSTPYMQDGKVSGAVSIIRDITDELAIEKAKDELVTLVSHELRTPLTILRWHASKLEENQSQLNLDPDSLKSLKYIFGAGSAMGAIVESILTVSKIELGKKFVSADSFDIIATINKTLKDLEMPSEVKHLKFVTNYPSAEVMVKADPNYTRIIVQNLIFNAIKYTPDSGTITLSVVENEGQVSINVADTGCGIPEEEKSKIFTKMYRATNARRIDPNGMGLGLYISRNVARLMEGDVTFDAVENEGSVFHLQIPSA